MSSNGSFSDNPLEKRKYAPSVQFISHPKGDPIERFPNNPRNQACIAFGHLLVLASLVAAGSAAPLLADSFTAYSHVGSVAPTSVVTFNGGTDAGGTTG